MYWPQAERPLTLSGPFSSSNVFIMVYKTNLLLELSICPMSAHPETPHFIGVVRPGSSQSLSRIHAPPVITSSLYLCRGRTGHVDTNIVFSFS